MYKQVCQTLQKKFSEGLQVTDPLDFTYERLLLNLSLLQFVFYILYFSGIWQGHGRFRSGKTPKKGTDPFIFRCAGTMEAIDCYQ